jgi:hypothetical protein
MTWTAWRLSRSSATAVAALAAAAVLFLVWSGHALRATFVSTGLAQCLVAGDTGLGCSGIAFDFFESTRTLSGGQAVVGFLSLAPGLIGAFVGAPLVAREIETGTLHLAWTQSVTRLRWFTVRSLVAMLIVVAGVATLTAGIAYWRWPLDQVQGRVEVNGYDVQGMVPVAYALFAYALGLCFGAVTRRVVPAIAATLGTFFVMRIAIEALVRPHLLAPVRITFVGDPPADLASRLNGAWVLEQSTPPPGSGLTTEYLFHPASSFWTLQLLESGLVLVLSLAVAGLAAYWVRHRVH